MVRDDDAIAADLDAFLGVGNGLNAFDSEGFAAADLLPGLDQPGHFLPAPRAAVPDIVDPFRSGLVGLRAGIDACFLEAALEDRIR